MGVADGLKNSMMVPVESYIDDDATFVVDTVNSEDFLLFVSALFADEDMARMLQNAPPLRPDVKEPLDAYYKARNALEKRHGNGDLYKKELKELSYPAITFGTKRSTRCLNSSRADYHGQNSDPCSRNFMSNAQTSFKPVNLPKALDVYMYMYMYRLLRSPA